MKSRQEEKAERKYGMPFRRYSLIAKLTFRESLLQLGRRVDPESRAPSSRWIIPTVLPWRPGAQVSSNDGEQYTKYMNLDL